MRPQAFFLADDAGLGGQRFCLFYAAAPGTALRGLVLYIHPFGEEMNKSRRMAALQSRALAQAGYAVLQIDLLGCGDSSGDFGDATWQAWVGDVVQGVRWLQQRHAPADTADTPGKPGTSGTLLTLTNAPPVWLWGLRAGCLLAVQAAQRISSPCHFLFWQPPASGKPLLQQFLRLKVAGDMLTGQSKGVMEGLRQQLGAGASVEIAGYLLSPGLATGLEQATLAGLPQTGSGSGSGSGSSFGSGSGSGSRVEWFEVSTREDATLSPVSAAAQLAWQTAGYLVQSHAVQGPAFWQTSEIEDAPGLIVATEAALSSEPAAAGLQPGLQP